MSALGKVSPHIQRCRQWFIYYAVVFSHFGNLLPQIASGKVFTEGTPSWCFYSPRQNVSALISLSLHTGDPTQNLTLQMSFNAALVSLVVNMT